MLVGYISDLHCEMCDDIIPVPDVDVLILAGDIHVCPKLLKSYLLCLRASSKAKFIYVMGNHEYYGHTFPDIRENYRNQVAKVPDAVLLERQSHIIDGVRFLGTTLWSDLSNPMHAMSVQHGLNDFVKIRVKGLPMRKKRPILVTFNHTDYHAEFEACRDWLEEELKKPFEGKTVVVTHHSPSSITCSPHYRYSRIKYGFHSDLSNLVIDHGPKLWIYGHDHVTATHELSKTKLVSNQPGYLTEHRRGAIVHTEEI